MALSISEIPFELSTRLIEEYLEIKKRFAMNDWGPGQLKGGRFAEAILRVYQYLLGDTVTPYGTDIPAAEKTRILNTLAKRGRDRRSCPTKDGAFSPPASRLP